MPHNFRVDMTLPTHPHFFGDSGGRWGGGGVPIARPAGFGDNGGRWGTRGGIPTQFPAGFGDSGGRWGGYLGISPPRIPPKDLRYLNRLKAAGKAGFRFGDSGALAYGGRPPFRLRAAAMGHYL